jgi:hypothetical protein
MRDTVAVCGLFCESCGIYIATQKKDDLELERLALMMKTTKEEIQCNGCRSSLLSPHCRNCEFRSCAQDKKLDNCEECRKFPCESLTVFQKKAPHRAELFKSAEYRKNNGIGMWLDKMRKDYSCPICKTINSPYFLICKKCGYAPCNEFINRNGSLFRK